MGSALEAVLALRQNEQAQQKAQADSIANAVQLFQSARQTALSNQLAMLQYKAGLAEKGLKQGPDGNFTYDPSTMNPLQQILTGTKLQADAKTAGNKAVYDLAGQVLNGAIPGSAQSSIPSGSPVAQVINPSSPSVAINNPIGSAVATTGMTPVSQTSNTDSITGITNTTTNSTNIPGKIAEANATELGQEQVAGQKAVARDYATADMLSGMFRSMTDKYAQAYKGGLAGNLPRSLMGTAADKGYDLFNFANKDALKAVGGFESVKNEAITRFNSIYSEQLGGKDASSRIFSTMLDLAQKELPDRANPPASVEGRIEGSMQNLTRMIGGSIGYLTKLHSSQDLANASPEQLDKWTSDALTNSSNYQLSPDVSKALKQRVDYINQPLVELQAPKGSTYYSPSTKKYYNAQGNEVK